MSYVSLESMLSEYGAISQAMVSRITVMTTGAGGLVQTPHGEIELTHTKRRRADIIQSTMSVKGRSLRIATKETAYHDLVGLGRNVGMVDMDELSS
jgi:hypothetical protein